MTLPLPEWPLALLLRGAPDSVHEAALTRLFNHALRGQPLARRLNELNGRRLCLTFTDAGRTLHFRIENGRIARQAGRDWDVRISGSLHDFLLLATRREDPDTLFFSRRLDIEGDTETGLHVKNLLDALEYDFDAHIIDVLGPTLGRHAGNLRRRFMQGALAHATSFRSTASSPSRAGRTNNHCRHRP